MGAHLDENGVFSSDKYSAWCPPGFVPLKLSGTPLWDYASHRNPAMPRTRGPR